VDFVLEVGSPLPGNLGMTFCPGMKDMGGTYYWSRDLSLDLHALRHDYGADVLVSLMEPREYEHFGVLDLFERAREAGLRVLYLPIRDVSTPADTGLDAEFHTLVLGVVRALARGETVVAHCRGGLGRTGLLAACTLVALGHEAQDAVELVREARPGAVQTPDQEDYVRLFEQTLG
jgi:protein-tyrosine phosphatase